MLALTYGPTYLLYRQNLTLNALVWGLLTLPQKAMCVHAEVSVVADISIVESQEGTQWMMFGCDIPCAYLKYHFSVILAES